MVAVPAVNIDAMPKCMLGMTRCTASWHARRDDGVLIHADDDFIWEECGL